MTVANATGCDVGDTIKIGGTTDSETVKISVVAGNNLTLSTPLTKAHASGSAVVEVASAATATATPKTLPQTGGNTGGAGDSVAMLFALTLGVVLLAAAGGSIFAARAKRED